MMTATRDPSADMTVSLYNARSPRVPTRLPERSFNARVVALFSNVSALRFALASAASLALASADNSCAATAVGSGGRTNRIAANAIAIRPAVFIDTSCSVNVRRRPKTLRTSAVLRARRDDAAARHGDGANEARLRLVARAAQFDGQHFPHAALEVGFA